MSSSEFPGITPGPWCSAYRKLKDRTDCATRGCKWYVNVVVKMKSHQTHTEGSPDVDENMNMVSIEKFTLPNSRVPYVRTEEECEWHCCKYDEPSALESLPWEMV